MNDFNSLFGVLFLLIDKIFSIYSHILFAILISFSSKILLEKIVFFSNIFKKERSNSKFIFFSFNSSLNL